MIRFNIWIVVGMVTAVAAPPLTQRHSALSSVVTFLVTVEGAFMGGLRPSFQSMEGDGKS